MVIEREELIILLSLKLESYLKNSNYYFIFLLILRTSEIKIVISDIDEIPDDGLRKNMNQLEFEEELESNFSISSTSKK